MNMECLVIGCTRFDGEFNGQRFRNCKVTYIPDYPEYSGNRKGMLPVTLKAPFEVFDQLSDLPGLYDLEVELKPTSKGATMEISRVNNLISSAEIKRG